MRKRLAAIIALFGLGLGAIGSAANAQSPPKVLSAIDADVYAVAFSAVRQGQFEAVNEAKRHVKDPCLMGRLTYLKLMHPDYHAEFSELKAWLAKNRDLPDADKIYALALKRGSGAPMPSMAQKGKSGGMMIVPSGGSLSTPKSALDPKMQAAREAFYNDGDVQTAFALATASGERWVGGMAAYRLGRYPTAVERFAALAHDQKQNEWVRSGAAFWAARSAIAAGEPEKATAYLRQAARTPYTFYGLIAERQLGLEPAIKAEGYDIGDEEAAETAPLPVESAPSLSEKAALQWAKSDKRAKRAAAYMQIGQRSDANEELRLALFSAKSDGARKTWQAFADAVGSPLGASSTSRPRHQHTFDLSDYQTPILTPTGGYTLERALVYAIIRQESHFNASAASPAGAYGLMQMTASTAAYNAGVSRASIDSSLLMDPSSNLRLGQDYVSRLLVQTQGDILRTVAAYNAGPKGVTKLAAALPDADSLLLIESLAGAETRDFVQRVMSNYWIYRQLFNQPSPTLDATAAGSKMILAAWDQTAADLDAPPAQPVDPTPIPPNSPPPPTSQRSTATSLQSLNDAKKFLFCSDLRRSFGVWRTSLRKLADAARSATPQAVSRA